MQTYTLSEEYITLGQVLKELGLIATGGQAKIFLAENDGHIFYNGEPENRRGKKLFDGDRLEIRSEQLELHFQKANPEELHQYTQEKAEEERVKKLVKKLNQENKATQPKLEKRKAPHFPGVK